VFAGSSGSALSGAVTCSPRFRECCRHPYCAVTLPSGGGVLPFRCSVLCAIRLAARCSRKQQLATADAADAAWERCRTDAVATTASFAAGLHRSSVCCLEMRHQMILRCCAKISVHVFAHDSSRESMPTLFPD